MRNDNGQWLWKLRNSNSAGSNDITAFDYGSTAGTPITGDWNGDLTTTIGVVRGDIGSDLLWQLRNTNSGGSVDAQFYYGANTDTPVVGDWDGDGIVTVGIAR